MDDSTQNDVCNSKGMDERGVNYCSQPDAIQFWVKNRNTYKVTACVGLHCFYEDVL